MSNATATRLAEIERELNSLATLGKRLREEGVPENRIKSKLSAAVNYQCRLVKERDTLMAMPAPVEVIAPVDTHEDMQGGEPWGQERDEAYWRQAESYEIRKNLGMLKWEEDGDKLDAANTISTPALPPVPPKKPHHMTLKKWNTKLAMLDRLEIQSRESLTGAQLEFRLHRLREQREEALAALRAIGVHPKTALDLPSVDANSVIVILAKHLGVSIPSGKLLREEYAPTIRRMFDNNVGIRLLFALGRFVKPTRAGTFKGEGIEGLPLYVGKRRRFFAPKKASVTTDRLNQVTYDVLNKAGKTSNTVTRNEVIKNRTEFNTGETTSGTIWQGVKVRAMWRWDGEFWIPTVSVKDFTSAHRFDGEDQYCSIDATREAIAVGFGTRKVIKFAGKSHSTIVSTPYDGDVHEKTIENVQVVETETIGITLPNVGGNGVEGAISAPTVTTVVEGAVDIVPRKRKPVDMEIAKRFKGLGMTETKVSAQIHHARKPVDTGAKRDAAIERFHKMDVPEPDAKDVQEVFDRYFK